jgi:hypothetical protein
MTAIALPRPRKRRKSKPAQVAQSVTKAVASVKVASTAGKAAKKGAKTWASFRVVKFLGRGGKKLLIIPIAAGGGLAAYKKLTSGSSEDEPATPYGSSVGPVATPATVTPPKTAPGSTADFNGEPAAGTTSPPATPPGTAS